MISRRHARTRRPATRSLALHRLESRILLDATIRGVVFDDIDGDGVMGAGESGLANWNVFVDANTNGVLDAGENVAITTADGSYVLQEAGGGSYTIAVELQAGYVQTAPVGGSWDVTLNDEETQSGVDFGAQLVDPLTLDLQASSDSGSSNTDNITIETSPVFDVSGFAEFYRLWRGDVQVSGDFETSATFTEATPLAYGVYTYTLQAVSAGGAVQEEVTLDVTIDLVGPEVQQVSPTGTAGYTVDDVYVVFGSLNQPTISTATDPTNYQLLYAGDDGVLGTADDVDAMAFIAMIEYDIVDGVARLVVDAETVELARGDYLLTVSAAGTLEDGAGNALNGGEDQEFEFTVGLPLVTVPDGFDPVIDLDTGTGTGPDGVGRILGDDAGDETGYSVAWGGDLNADGYTDCVFSAPGESGVAYLLFGKADNWTDLDLNQIDDMYAGTSEGTGPNGIIRITPPAGSDWSQLFVSGAGDLNGDGVQDLMIGAPVDDPGDKPDAGVVYIIWGHSGEWTDIDFSEEVDASTAIRILGATAGDGTGVSLSPPGDVNGDGQADIIIGAYGASPGTTARNIAGMVYVVFGSSSAAAWEGDLDLATAGEARVISIAGAAAGDLTGYCVAGAGDVNGDGMADIAISAHRADYGGRIDAGAVWVVFGRDDWNDLDLLTEEVESAIAIYGEGAGEWFGYACAGLRDVNQDGYGDFIVGAPRATANGGRPGKAYIVFGRSGWNDIDLATNPQGFIEIIGAADGDETGRSVSGAGDVDGDGIDDVLVAAHRADASGGTDSGIVYLLFGLDESVTQWQDVDLSEPIDSSQIILITGDDAFDVNGANVAGAGDLNGDGYDDFLVGATKADPIDSQTGELLTEAGEVYFIFGRGQDKAVITGYLYADNDADGILDPEDEALEGWLVYLDDQSTGTVGQYDPGEQMTYTDEDGFYQFQGLGDGSYTVREVIQTGWTQTLPGGTGEQIVAIVDGESVTDVDFMNAPPVTITGFKYLDLDGDGTRDADEPGLPGWMIYAEVDGIEGRTAGDIYTTTQADGSYVLTGIPVLDLITGTIYDIAEEIPAGWYQTEPGGLGFYTLTVFVGDQFVLDFGNWAAAGAVEISGVKFEDIDADGVQDPDEPGLAGWTIYIDANENDLLDDDELRAVTDEDGFYSIVGIPAGTYTLREDAQGDWVATTGDEIVVVLAEGESALEADFGNFLSPTVDAVLQAASDSGTSSSDGITNIVRPTVDVTFNKPGTVEIDWDDDGTYDQAFLVAEAGTVGLTAPFDLTEGAFDITVQLTDIAAATATSAVPVVIDTTAPDAPANPLDLRPQDDTGVANDDDITAATELTFNFDAPTVGDYFRVRRDGALISGYFGNDVQFTTLPEPDSVSSYVLTYVDAAGNESVPSAALVVTVDTEAPDAPDLPDLQAAVDSGQSDTDDLTNIPAIAIDLSGFADYYRLFLDGFQITADYATDLTVFDALAGDGTYQYTLYAVDPAGNVSEVSATLSVTLDTTGPTVDSITPSVLSTTAVGSFDVLFADVNGMWDTTVTDVANYALTEAGADGTFGTADDVDLSAQIDSVSFDEPTMTATVTLTGALGEGLYRLTVDGDSTVMDLAGNALNDGADSYSDVLIDFPPVFLSPPDEVNATEDVALTGVDFETNEEGSGLTYALSGAPAWLTVDENTGVLIGTPLNCTAGTFEVAIEATDSVGTVVSHTFDLIVANADPYFISAPSDLYATEDTLFNYDFNVDDETHGDGVTYTLLNAPAWLTVTDASTGTVGGLPINGHSGDFNVTIQADDTHGGTVQHDFVLHVSNVAPVFTTTPDTLVFTEDNPASYNFQTDDEGVASGVTYSLMGGEPSGVSIGLSNGVLSVDVVNCTAGSYDLTVRAEDGFGGVTDHDFTLNILNRAPQFIGATAAAQATEAQSFSLDFNTDDEGVGAGVTYELINAPAWLSVTNAATGTIGGTPLLVPASVGVVTIRATDTHGGVTDHDFTLTTINDAPQIDVAEPILGTSLFMGQDYTVTWTDNDPETDASIDLFWDVDTDMTNNTVAQQGIGWGTIATGISEDSLTDSYDWLVDAPDGDYHILGTITDGVSTTHDYTVDTVRVTNVALRAQGVVDGVTVTIYDLSPDEDPSNPIVAFGRDQFVKGVTDILIDEGKPGDGELKSITFFNDGDETADLGLFISGGAVGQVKDARKSGKFGPAVSDLGLIVSSHRIGDIKLNAGLTGFNANGLSMGGIDFANDIDGDGDSHDDVAVFSAASLGKARFDDGVNGDVLVMDADGHGVSLGSFQTRSGGYHGDMITAGDIGTLDLRGGFGSTIQTGGGIKSLRIQDGAASGDVQAQGLIQRIQVKRRGSQLNDGSFDGSIVANSGLKSVQIDGDFTGEFDVDGGLGSAKIGGWVSESSLDITGHLGSLTVGSDFINSVVDATSIGRVAVKGAGRIRSDQEWEAASHYIRARQGSFKVSDYVWSGTIDSDDWHLFYSEASGLWAFCGEQTPPDVTLPPEDE